MRRVSLQYIQPGMVLSRDAYDFHGNVILALGTRLTIDNISTLSRMGGGEVFIEDRRVDDVSVTSLMPARLEGAAVQKLHELLDSSKAIINSSGSQRIDLTSVEQTIFSMVEILFPVVMGEVNATGCFSLKDYDHVHPVQVTSLSLLMGRKAGYDEAELAKLGLAALLENIGYIVLPPGMLGEPGQLTKTEVQELHQHPSYGYQILTEHARHVAPESTRAIFEHHERWDGSGYPRGLKGSNISHYARILAVVDTYYALASRRPHRQRYLPNEAIEFIMAYSGELFDPELVQLFTRLVPLYPTGVTVKLNTGEMGIVSDARVGFIGRPTVRICYDKHQNEVAKPTDMDLVESEHQHRLVTEVVEY